VSEAYRSSCLRSEENFSQQQFQASPGIVAEKNFLRSAGTMILLSIFNKQFADDRSF